MKVIDQKGRLFGIINIIDLAVLLIIFSGIGFAGYKMLGHRIAGTAPSTSEVVFSVLCSGKSENAAKALNKGDQLISGTSYVNGFIESVSYKDAEMMVTTDDGRIVKATDPSRKDILVTVKAYINTNAAALKLGNQEIRIGMPHYLKTQKVEITGFIDSLEFK